MAMKKIKENITKNERKKGELIKMSVNIDQNVGKCIDIEGDTMILSKKETNNVCIKLKHNSKTKAKTSKSSLKYSSQNYLRRMAKCQIKIPF